MSIRGGWDFSVGPHPIPAANTLRTLMLDPPAPTQSPWWLHGAETGGTCEARGRRGEGATKRMGHSLSGPVVAEGVQGAIGSRCTQEWKRGGSQGERQVWGEIKSS